MSSVTGSDDGKQLVSNMFIQHRIGICVTRHRQELNKYETVRTKTTVLVSQSLRLVSGSGKVNSDLVTGMWLGVYLCGCSYSCMQTWLGGIGKKKKKAVSCNHFLNWGRHFLPPRMPKVVSISSQLQLGSHFEDRTRDTEI